MDDTEIEIDIDLSEPYTIDISALHPSSYTYTTIPTGAQGSLYGSSSGINGSSWITTPLSSTTLDVKGDARFDGDIKWKGRSLGKLLESIEDRLAILQEPSPEKLEKYAALKKAYDHYKTLERLIGED